MAAKKKTKKKTAKKKVAKKPAKKAAKKKAFGGYTISFKGCKDTMEKVFGTKPLPPSQMTKKLWTYVKSKNLSKK